MNDALRAAPVLGVPNAFRPWHMLSVVVVITAINLGAGWMVAQLNIQIWPWHSELIDTFVLTMIVAYIVAMAMPFVPGIEIGIALMLLLGKEGIVLAFLCTQIALTTSFLVGRWIPTRTIIAVLSSLGLQRACALARKLESMSQAQRLEVLTISASGGWRATLLKHRSVAFAAALNLPGNAMIGGAGGLCMLAGMSRLISFPNFVMLVALATTPIPLFFFLLK